jgi:hypothetical protein
MCDCFKEEAGRGFFLDGGFNYCRRGGNFEDIKPLKTIRRK